MSSSAKGPKSSKNTKVPHFRMHTITENLAHMQDNLEQERTLYFENHETRLAMLEKQFNDSVQQYESHITQLNHSIQNLNTEIGIKDKIISDLDNTKIKSEKKLSQLNEWTQILESRLKNLEDEYAKLKKAKEDSERQWKQEFDDLNTSTYNLIKQQLEKIEGAKEKLEKRDQRNEQLANKIEELNRIIQQLEHDLENERNKVMQLQKESADADTENDALKDQISQLIRQISQLNKTIDDKDDIIEDLQKQIEMLKKQIQELKQLVKENEGKDDKIRQLEKKIKELTSQVIKQKETIVITKQIKSDYEDLLEKNRQLEGLLKRSNDQNKKMADQLADRDKRIAELGKLLNDRDKEIQSLKEEIEGLKALVKKLEDENDRLRKENEELKKQRQSCECDKLRRDIIDLEDQLVSLKPSIYEFSEEIEQPNTSFIRSSKRKQTLAQQMNEKQKRKVKENPLLKKVYGINEQSLPIEKVFRLFEELMNKKHKQDNDDLKAVIRPRPMTSYMLEYLITTTGLKSLVNKNLAQLLLGLKELYTQEHEYGTLFSRILQLFHPAPVDLVLLTFLVKIRMEFNNLVTDYAQQKTHQSELARKLRSKQMGKENYELMQVGGEATLFDAYMLIQSTFDEDKHVGVYISQKLVPEKDTDAEDFLNYMLVTRINKIGKIPGQLFDQMDKEGRQKINIEEFKYGIQKFTGLFMSNSELNLLFKSFDLSRSNQWITDMDFITKFGELSNKRQSKFDWLITKSRFLTMMADAYEEWKNENIQKIESIFNQYDQDDSNRIDLAEFQHMMQHLDQDGQFAPDDINKIFKSAVKNASIGINNEQVWVITQKHCISPYYCSVFRTEQVYADVERQETKKLNKKMGAAKVKGAVGATRSQLRGKRSQKSNVKPTKSSDMLMYIEEDSNEEGHRDKNTSVSPWNVFQRSGRETETPESIGYGSRTPPLKPAYSTQGTAESKKTRRQIRKTHRKRSISMRGDEIARVALAAVNNSRFPHKRHNKSVYGEEDYEDQDPEQENTFSDEEDLLVRLEELEQENRRLSIENQNLQQDSINSAKDFYLKAGRTNSLENLSPSNKSVQQYQSEMERKEKQISALKATLQGSQADVLKLQEFINQIPDQQEEINQLKSLLKSKDSDLEQKRLQLENEELKAQIQLTTQLKDNYQLQMSKLQQVVQQYQAKEGDEGRIDTEETRLSKYESEIRDTETEENLNENLDAIMEGKPNK